MFYEKVERCHTKGKVQSGIKTWTIQNSYPVISSIDKLNKHKAAKGMSTFDFLTLYTEIPRDKLLFVLDEITHFAFKGRTRDYVAAYNSGAFWSRSKSKTGRSYCPRNKILSGVFSKQQFFQVGSKIFRRVIGIPMGSDPAPFFANLFSFFYESRWLKSIENTKVVKCGNIFRFIYD